MSENTSRKREEKLHVNPPRMMIRAACDYKTFCQGLMSTADSKGLHKNNSVISYFSRTVHYVFLFMYNNIIL